MGKRVPRARPGGAQADYNRRVIERNCLVKILERVDIEPALSVSIWNNVESNLVTSVTVDPRALHSEQNFDSTKVKSIRQLPEPWMAAWIVKASGKKTVSAQRINDLHGRDTHVLVQIICVALMVLPTWAPQGDDAKDSVLQNR